MSRPEKTYPLTLSQIDAMATEIAFLDGLRVDDADTAKKLASVNAAYDILTQALGEDAKLVFRGDDE